MTYNRVATPRMYMDRLSFDLATGQRTISNYTITDDAGSPATVTPSSGDFEDLFDFYDFHDFDDFEDIEETKDFKHIEATVGIWRILKNLRFGGC